MRSMMPGCGFTKIFRKILLTLCFSLTLKPANARDFDEIDLKGDCTEQNTQILENGGVLSVLFSEMGVEMRQGEKADGKSAKKACHFKTRLRFPSGMYLAGLRQTYSGGIVKSRRTRGFLQLFADLGSKQKKPKPLIWGEEEAITPESEQSVFVRILEESVVQPKHCSGEIRYHLRVTFEAHRKTYEDFFIGGIDTYDSELVHRVELTPNWKHCDKRD